MKLQDLKKEIDIFNSRIKILEIALRQVLKLKTPLNLTIGNCSIKDESIIITHPDMKTQIIPENMLDNVEEIKKQIQINLEREEREKKLYELKWQIDYWSAQLNQENLNNKIKNLENMKSELAVLQNTP
jgi:hypothetical protein